MSGSIIPTPLAMPTTRAGPPPTVAAATLGTVSVVMIPVAAAVGVRVAGRARGIAGDAGEHAVDRVAPADHARRGDEHVAGGQPSRSATAVDERLGVGAPGRPVGDVGVLRHDDDRPGPPVGEVLAADRHARAGEAAAREHPGRGDRLSAAMTTKSSVSSLTPTLATWQPKPAGERRHRFRRAEAVADAPKMRAIASMSRALEADLAPHGLTLGDYQVLVYLSEADDHAMRMCDLAARLQLSPSGLTRRLDGLVRGRAGRAPAVASTIGG